MLFVSDEAGGPRVRRQVDMKRQMSSGDPEIGGG